MFNLDTILQQELDELKKHGLYRTMKRIDSMQGPTVLIDGKEVILLSSNNYLGLASHPEVIKAQIEAVQEFGAGSCASRLISGNIYLYEKLEKKIADFKGTEDALVFATGYMANVGTISAFAGKDDVVICDKLNHASIIDGCRVSGATLRVYLHKNMERLEELLSKSKPYKKRLIITDGVFSMDGDIAPLADIIKLCQKYEAILMVDDAHATGVLGTKGKGTCEYFGITKGIDIQMGTLSKTFGNLGGYIAGSKRLIEYIRNKARSFIYSTALPPAVLGGALKAVEIAERDNTLREKLWCNVKMFKQGLVKIGFDVMESETQIIPIYTGTIEATMTASRILHEEGIFAPGIRPPTVSKNKCRIRASLMATHTEEHIERSINAFKRLLCNRN